MSNQQNTTSFIISVTSESFEKEVLRSSKPTIVDFWAPWCGVCKAVEPIVQAFAEKQQQRVKVVMVNAQDALDIAQRYGVRQLPTFVAFSNGEIIRQHIGKIGERELMELAGITV